MQNFHAALAPKTRSAHSRRRWSCAKCPFSNTEFGIWSAGDSNERRQAEVFTETFRALTEVSAWDAQRNDNEAGYVAGITWWAAFDRYTAHARLQTMDLYKMDRTSEKLAPGILREAYAVWNPLQ